MSNEGRALLTDTERKILSGEKDVTDDYRYKVQSVVRKRARDQLGDDLQFLADHFRDAYDLAIENIGDVYPCPRCGKVYPRASETISHAQSLAYQEGDDTHDDFSLDELPAYFDQPSDGGGDAASS